jgi:hypothetical protein
MPKEVTLQLSIPTTGDMLPHEVLNAINSRIRLVYDSYGMLRSIDSNGTTHNADWVANLLGIPNQLNAEHTSKVG